MKTKSMKLADYFEFRKAQYEILQLIPTKSNKNNQTDKIADLVNKMYRKTDKLIYKENKKLIIEQQYKFSFYIHIEKYSVKFYAIIPKIYLNQFKVKFRDTWKNIQIETVDELPIDVNQCTKYQLHYKYDDALSLKTDLRSNELLNSNLSITSIMEEGEITGLFYNFIPTPERESNYFRNKTYKNSVQRYKNGDSLKKSKNIKDYSVFLLKNLINFINDLLNCILNASNNNQLILNPIEHEISNSTKRKGDKAICKNQTIIIAKSSEKEREMELSKTLANTFKSISDNNELIVTEITKEIDIKRTIINHTTVNKTTVEECSNFINMPSTEVIKQFNMIEHNKVLELKAPKCLEEGEIRIGYVKENENTKEVYYSMDEQMKRMSRVLMGSQGAGKDYYMGNLSEDIIKANRSLFVIDYIDECQLADDIKRRVPGEKLIEINTNKDNELQAFLINELTYKDCDSLDIKIEVSMQKAQQFELLLDTINDVKSELSPRMLRYLY